MFFSFSTCRNRHSNETRARKSQRRVWKTNGRVQWNLMCSFNSRERVSSNFYVFFFVFFWALLFLSQSLSLYNYIKLYYYYCCCMCWYRSTAHQYGGERTFYFNMQTQLLKILPPLIFLYLWISACLLG